ncbi:hypothetical protein [Micromonospora sp. NPDC005367]|uniref:hypothetical protein n=1 Tax=Micromonospora sp. NPDC005367 TaxID=3155590 RepID=UPI0033BA2768
MTGASAMSMFAALLDRSVARIGERVADGRRFDRQATNPHAVSHTVDMLLSLWDDSFTVTRREPGAHCH